MQRESGLSEPPHWHARSTGLYTNLPPHRGCHHWIWNHVRPIYDSRVENLTVSISGSVPVAFAAMLGPRFGMRGMIITRYVFGYWGAVLISLLNILTQVCFNVSPTSEHFLMCMCF